MLNRVSSVFAIAVALVSVTGFAQEGPGGAATPPKAVTAMKPIIDEYKKLDIVETAMKSGSFKTLSTAIKAAGLADTLKGSGPFTVFAPTDEAFDKLPQGTLESLLRPENKEKLKAILTYHVVPGDMLAADVSPMKTLNSVNGEPLSIKTEGENIMVNDAKVTKTNIDCTNGVIHAIDKVLMPR